MVPMSKVLGFRFLGGEMMTGLPEYRNGGLLVDTGLLTLKKKDFDQGVAAFNRNADYKDTPTSEIVPLFEPADDVIVEWRAVTVGFLDELLIEVNEGLGLTGSERLSLAQMLEAGTWKVSPFRNLSSWLPYNDRCCDQSLFLLIKELRHSSQCFIQYYKLMDHREGVRLLQLDDHEQKAHQSQSYLTEPCFDDFRRSRVSRASPLLVLCEFRTLRGPLAECACQLWVRDLLGLGDAFPLPVIAFSMYVWSIR